MLVVRNNTNSNFTFCKDDASSDAGSTAFSAALRYELRRAERDNQTLLAAGWDIGPDNDAVLRFKQLWVEPGLCDDAAYQSLL